MREEHKELLSHYVRRSVSSWKRAAEYQNCKCRHLYYVAVYLTLTENGIGKLKSSAKPQIKTCGLAFLSTITEV